MAFDRCPRTACVPARGCSGGMACEARARAGGGGSLCGCTRHLHCAKATKRRSKRRSWRALLGPSLHPAALLRSLLISGFFSSSNTAASAPRLALSEVFDRSCAAGVQRGLSKARNYRPDLYKPGEGRAGHQRLRAGLIGLPRPPAALSSAPCRPGVAQRQKQRQDCQRCAARCGLSAAGGRGAHMSAARRAALRSPRRAVRPARSSRTASSSSSSTRSALTLHAAPPAPQLPWRRPPCARRASSRRSPPFSRAPPRRPPFVTSSASLARVR